MTRPIELMNASKACAEAWQRRDDMIEAGDKVGVQAMNVTCHLLDEIYRAKYHVWQILGGTSDIDSIALPFVDYDHADWLDAQATNDCARPALF